MTRRRSVLAWGMLVLALGGPLALAARSPQLAWRDPVYIAAGFAGVLAMGLLFIQPLLAGGLAPGLPAPRARRAHKLVGVLLIILVLVHVGALWLTSPPDMVDALLLRSPTPFSIWGVIAMIGVFVTALLAATRRKLRPRLWRIGHRALATLIVGASIAHALMIEGTMEWLSKVLLCLLVALTSLWAIRAKQPWTGRRSKSRR